MNSMDLLVHQAQQGDEEAYSELFQQVETDIYRTAYVYLKNQEDALDVVRETAYRSFSTLRSLREPKHFKTWVIQIAIRCSIDMCRHRKKVIPLDPGVQDKLAITIDGDIPLSVTLREFIDLLDKNEKSVVLLKYYYDYTIADTSDILDIPLGTAKTILYRALKKLRGLVEGEGLHE